MILKKITWLSILAGCSAVASALSTTSLSSFVEEDVDIFISMHSPAELRQMWEGHPFQQVVANPELQQFLQPLTNLAVEEDGGSMSSVLENEFELTWDQLFELFPGQVAVAWFNVAELLLRQAERPELAIMAEYAGDPDQLMQLMQIQFERNAERQRKGNPLMEHTLLEESFMGETLYFDEAFDGEETYIEDGYALVDGIFILATPQERLRTAVESIKESPDASLAENNAYLRSREQGGRGDLSLYINMEAILPPLNAELISKSMERGAAMLGLSARSLDATLALESIRALYLDLDLVEVGLSAHSGLIYREKTGLMRLMTYSQGPLPEARYVPKGVFASSVTTFDLGAMLAELEALLSVASPSWPLLLDLQMQKIRTNTGVDLRSALLDNLGGDMVSLSILPEEVREETAMLQADQVYVLDLKDAQALSDALEALLDLVPGMRAQIQSLDFAGQTIYTMRTPPAADMPETAPYLMSYVITRSKLIFSMGRIGLLQEVLTAMEAGSDGFWQEPETTLLFERIASPHAVSRSYLDLEKLRLPLFQSMVKASQMGGEATALDMNGIPAALSLPFQLISEICEFEDGLFTRSFILQQEDSQ